VRGTVARRARHRCNTDQGPVQLNAKRVLILQAEPRYLHLAIGIAHDKGKPVPQIAFVIKPLYHVLKAQKYVSRSVEKKRVPIIVGDKGGHAEVAGLLGHSKSKGVVIENEDEVDSLPYCDKVSVVAQTTQSKEKYDQICEKIRKRYSDVQIFDTICDATAQRQNEAIEIAEKVDAMVVVGGKHSANTLRLTQICSETGTPTIHIETAGELPIEELGVYRLIGVTAGASTPHWIIRNVIEELERLQRKKKPVTNFLYNLLEWLIYPHFFLGIGAALLVYCVSLLLEVRPSIANSALAFCYIVSMHILNKYLSLPKDRSLLYGAQKFMGEKSAFVIVLGIGGIIASVFIASTINMTVFLVMVVSIILGLLYSTAIIPGELFPRLKYRRLMDIPGSKDIFTAVAWSVVTVIVPVLESGSVSALKFITAFLAIGLLVLVRAIVFDIRDIEGDILVGRETVPVTLGEKSTSRLLQFTLFLVGLLLFICGVAKVFTSLAFVLLLVVFFSGSSFFLAGRQKIYQSIFYDLFVDSQFILAGILAYVWQTIVS